MQYLLGLFCEKVFRVQNLYKKLILCLFQGVKLAKEILVTYNS